MRKYIATAGVIAITAIVAAGCGSAQPTTPRGTSATTPANSTSATAPTNNIPLTDASTCAQYLAASTQQQQAYAGAWIRANEPDLAIGMPWPTAEAQMAGTIASACEGAIAQQNTGAQLGPTAGQM